MAGNETGEVGWTMSEIIFDSIIPRTTGPVDFILQIQSVSNHPLFPISTATFSVQAAIIILLDY